MGKLPRKLKIYIRLTRWEDYFTFTQLVFGFILARNFVISGEDGVLLIKTIFVLAPLLYGGIYTLNNIVDADFDRLNPKKADRPIPAGEITKSQAGRISAILISAGILGAYLVDLRVFYMAVSFLAVNLAYTFWAKHVPYLSIAVNSATHLLRLIFGMWLAGSFQYGYVVPVFALGQINGTVFRYIKEIHDGGIEARPVLKFYKLKSLWAVFYAILAGIGLFVVFGRPWEKAVGLFFIAMHLFNSIGYFRSKRIKRLIDFSWR